MSDPAGTPNQRPIYATTNLPGDVPLTDVVDWLIQYRDVRGYMPTLLEVAAEFRLTGKPAATLLLQRLAAAGLAERDPKVARGLRLLHPAEKAS